MMHLVLPYPREDLAPLYKLGAGKLSKYGGRLHVLMRRFGAKAPPQRPWVGRVLQSGRLEFLRGHMDYEQADDLGESGVVVRWNLTPGTYRIYDWFDGTRTITVGESHDDTGTD